MATTSKTAGNHSATATSHEPKQQPDAGMPGQSGHTTPNGDPKPHGHARKAAERAAQKNSVAVTVPYIGTITLPAAEELAFLGGVGVLAVVGAIEWPIAAAIGAGHVLANNRRNQMVREFGEALERV